MRQESTAPSTGESEQVWGHVGVKSRLLGVLTRGRRFPPTYVFGTIIDPPDRRWTIPLARSALIGPNRQTPADTRHP